MKRSADAAKDASPLVRASVAIVQDFFRNVQDPEFDYLPIMIAVLRFIQRIENETTHKQMAMELSNYVKKLVRRFRALSTLEARALEETLEARLNEAEVMESVAEATRNANAVSRAVARMRPASIEISNENLAEVGMTRENFERANESGISNANLATVGMTRENLEGENSTLSNANLASFGMTRANFEGVSQSPKKTPRRRRRSLRQK